MRWIFGFGGKVVWNGFIKKVGKGFNRKVGQWFGTVYTPMDCTRGDRAGITSYLFSNQRKILVGIAFPKAIYPPKDGKEDKHKTEGVVGQGIPGQQGPPSSTH